MKVLIYSDVHGNLPAFEIMLENEGPCDKYICLGDLVNYGPWSNECVELAFSLPNSILIMGNHEEAFIKGGYPGSNELVQSFFKKTRPHFTKGELIKQFVNDFVLDHFICKHTINEMYIYPDTNIELKNNFIIGHSHHQFSYSNSSFILFNSGSVGQNRKFINEINYLIYDTETKFISMKSILYDIEPIINKMKKENYPKICIDYYLEKERKINKF
jgi:predicted phosphodiesterase